MKSPVIVCWLDDDDPLTFSMKFPLVVCWLDEDDSVVVVVVVYEAFDLAPCPTMALF